MINIVLRKEGKDVKYEQDFIPVAMLKKGIKVQELFNNIGSNGLSEKEIDSIIKFEVELYGNQFTAEELENGFRANKIVSKVISDLNVVFGNVEEKLEEIPSDEKN